MKTFLFQGDSITDAGRERTENSQWLGNGYATMAAGMLALRYPGELRFENRAISGDRSVDLYARIKRDVINLQPDYLSILVGVNDVWHEFSFQDGVSAEKYEKIYDMYVEEILEALPQIRIFILEPFVTGNEVLEQFGMEFRREVERRAESARRVADRHHQFFVPLQDGLDELEKRFGAEYVTLEGVHPVIAGHAYIAERLVNAFVSELQ